MSNHYSVKVSNVFEQLDVNDQQNEQKKKRKKKKKKKKNINDANENNSVPEEKVDEVSESKLPKEIGDNINGSEIMNTEDVSGWHTINANKKKKGNTDKNNHDSSKNKNSDDCKNNDTLNVDPKPFSLKKRRVSFGNITQITENSHPQLNSTHKAALKHDASTLEEDSGIVNHLTSLGYSVDDIVHGMKRLHRKKNRNIEINAETVLQEIQLWQKKKLEHELNSNVANFDENAKVKSMHDDVLSLTRSSSSSSDDDHNDEMEHTEIKNIRDISSVEEQLHRRHLSSSSSKENMGSDIELSTVEQLNLDALQWDGTANLLQFWLQHLHDINNTTFINDFLSSQALDNIILNVMHGKINGKNNVQKLVVELLDFCILGDHSYHVWVIKQLEKVGLALSVCNEKEDLEKELVKLFVQQKNADLLKDVKFVISLPQQMSSNSKKNGNKNKNKTNQFNNDNNNNCNDVDDRLSQLKENAQITEGKLKEHKSQIERVNKLLSDIKLLNTGVLTHFDKISNKLSKVGDELEILRQENDHNRSILLNQKGSLTNEQKNKISELMKQKERSVLKYEMLKQRRKELELELKEINDTLLIVESEKEEITNKINDISNGYSNTIKQIKSEEDKLSFDIAVKSKEVGAIHHLKGFVGEVQLRVSTFADNTKSAVVSSGAALARIHIKHYQELINCLLQIIVFLRERIEFCEKKLSQTLADSSSMLSLGMDITPLTSQLERKIADDKLELQYSIKRINAILNEITTHISKYKEVQAMSEYRSLYQLLQNYVMDKSFDIAILPPPVINNNIVLSNKKISDDNYKSKNLSNHNTKVTSRKRAPMRHIGVRNAKGISSNNVQTSVSSTNSIIPSPMISKESLKDSTNIVDKDNRNSNQRSSPNKKKNYYYRRNNKKKPIKKPQ